MGYFVCVLLFVVEHPDLKSGGSVSYYPVSIDRPNHLFPLPYPISPSAYLLLLVLIIKGGRSDNNVVIVVKLTMHQAEAHKFRNEY